MNYGHPLQFGTFITPSNRAPDAVVALAKRSESLGYDLVTFQDHPYQSAYLDTWTLMSWVAGQTSRIHIAPNVLNLPLRIPSVIARSAASLDLLSDGRLALGLGAGAFWDAIKAMGGQKLAAGEAVTALDEAIDIIRGLLDTGSPGGFRFHGAHYQVSGARRGPAPAHEIPLWIGGYKPRMLRLIGEKADGWLPSLAYMQLTDIPTSNGIIDEAAQAAGRDPREIRRMLNISGKFAESRGGFLEGPAAQWVDELLPLVLEGGIGTFILTGDDVHVMERFAAEVAPALREAVLHEQPDIAQAAPVRRAAIRARRHEAIDYESVPASLADKVIEPGDMIFSRVKSTYMRGGMPGLVFQVENTDDIIAALAFARRHPDVLLSVRSGGHGISGRSTSNGGIVINLAKLNRIEILDEATRRIRVGAGARWMDVAAAIAPYGWALSSGDYGGVGVGGLATAGGVGWLSRKHGLTIDHLVAVDMVLADGALVRADAQENADLFWAVRGAGANFGIVTAFEFEVYEVGDVGWAQFVFDASDTAHFLERWGAVVEKSPRDLTSFLIMGKPQHNQPVIAQVMTVVDSDDAETIIRQLQPLANVAPMYDQSVVITPYASIMANAQGGDHHGQGEPIARSGLVEHITPAFAEAAARMIRSGAVHFFQIRAVGGAVSDVAPDATAYANRSANFHIAALGANRQRLNTVWDELYPHMRGMYLSFDTDPNPARINDAFPPETLARLRTLKAKYDPTNVFRDNFNITQAAVSEEAR